MPKVSKKKVIEIVAEEPVQAPTAPIKEEKSYNTCVLMFTIEGHKTWRLSTFQKKEHFNVYLSKQPKHPKVTEKRWFVADRINGTITEEK